MPTVVGSPGESFVKRKAAPAYFIQATLPIDIAHELRAATEQAQFEEVAARLDINRVRNEVVYSTESAFYSILRAQALLKVAEENRDNSNLRLSDAQARYKAQVVAYIDVVRAQTDVADAQRQVIAAQNAVVSSKARLAQAIGIEITPDFDVTAMGAVLDPFSGSIGNSSGTGPGMGAEAASGSPTSALGERGAPTGQQTPAANPSGPTFQDSLTQALLTRPEIQEAQADILAANKGIYVAQRSDLPSIAFNLGYYDLRSNTGTQINEPQAFVGLVIPFYDGGLAKARKEEAEALVKSAQVTKRQQIDSVSLDVQNAVLAVTQAREQIAVANQGVVEARTGFDLAKVRYNAGVSSRAGISPQLELSDAQAALTLAEQNQVNALYDYNEAEAQLNRATGKFAF